LLLHACVDPVGGHLRAADHDYAVRPQHAPRLADNVAPAGKPAEHLDQQHRVERSLAERKLFAIRLHKTRSVLASDELAQHPGGYIDAHVLVAAGYKRRADASAARAEIEQARLRD